MAKRQIIGLSIESQNIVVTKVERVKNRYVVKDTAFVNIAELINAPAGVENEPELVTGDDLFGFEDPDTENSSDQPEEDKSENLDEFSLDDDWMNTSDEELKADVSTRVVNELYGVLNRFGGKKMDIGLIIPSGNVMFNNISKPKDIKSAKKINSLVKSRVESIYGVESVEKDSFKWMQNADDKLTVASTLETSILLELLERLNKKYPHTFFIRTLLPEEVALLRFLKDDGDKSEGSTVLISLNKDGARIIFTQKNRIQSAMPLIPMKTAGKAFINKVFSRIMMELEKGQVNYVNQFLVYDRTGKGGVLIEMLDQNFEGIHSEFLNPDNLVDLPAAPVAEEIENTEEPEAPNLAAIAAALAAVESPTTLESHFNFLPQRVLDRQKVFKLKWHGILLLILIAMVPITGNYVYQDLIITQRDLGFQSDRNTQQIESLTEIQQQIQILDQQNSLLQDQVRKIEELSKESYLWRETLDILGAGLPNIRNTWLTSLQYNENAFVIEGMTMFRERVPRLTDLFAEAGIQRVTVSEVRDRNMFTFTIVIGRIVDDPGVFDPQVEFETEVTL